MKRIFNALLLLLWLPLLAHAACCTLVTSGSKADPGALDNSSAYTTTAISTAINAGDKIAIGYANFNTNPTNLGLPTLSTGDTCARQFAQYDTNQSHGVAAFVCTFASSQSANTVTYTVNKNTQTSSVETAYVVIRGASTTGTLDGAAVSTATNGTNDTVAMTATSIANDALIAVFSGRDTSNVTINSPQTGWTPGPTVNDATGLTQVAIAYQFTTSAGSYTAGWPAITNGASKWVLVGGMALAGPAAAGALNLGIIREN